MTKGTRTKAIVVATSEEAARGFPLYVNWRSLLLRGLWSPEEGRRYSVRALGPCLDADIPDGPLMFEGA